MSSIRDLKKTAIPGKFILQINYCSIQTLAIVKKLYRLITILYRLQSGYPFLILEFCIALRDESTF